jgi:methyl-accepting chemotaxis protein
MIYLLQETQIGIKSLILTIQDNAHIFSAVDSELSVMTSQSARVVETDTTMEHMVHNIERLDQKQSESVLHPSAVIEQMIGAITTRLIQYEPHVQQLATADEKGSAGLQQVSQAVQKVALESERLLESNRVIQHIASQTNLQLAESSNVQAKTVLLRIQDISQENKQRIEVLLQKITRFKF